MRHAKRRKWDVVLLAGSALLVGGAGTIGALVGDTERIGNYWLHAEVGDPDTRVVEVIDYDFGPRQRRGILRNIPDVDPSAAISVQSPTAPDDLVVTGLNEARLRVGDPSTTISGRHRYTITYPIGSLVEGTEFAWDAVGTDWTVPINNAEIHITADRDFTDIRCDRGNIGDQSGCIAFETEPGHIVADVSGLSDREGVTIYATLGDPLGSAPAAPIAPTGPADDPGSGWLVPGLAGLAAAGATGAVSSRLVRNLGREQVWKGGAADAAFGPREGETVGVELMDHEQLADMATIEFESPKGLSAAAGGIIHDEGVRSQHQIAWLIECAIRDEVILEEADKKKMTLRRGSAVPHPAVADQLAALFGGANEVELGKYDERFSTAWTQLGKDLDEWSDVSGLWDPAGAQRTTRARILGSVAALVGLGLAFLGGVVANRAGVPWLFITIIGGLIAGAGLAAVVRSWELAVRTPRGSGQWLQVESFRRFIAQSEARHAEAAAKMGLLRHYTAWAVALGELDHWKDAVEAAAAVPDSMASRLHHDFAFVAMAPSISRATTQTFTAPSSSSGGGGGGGVGGGGGGGGGGSW